MVKRKSYSAADVSLLKTLSHQAAIAIENASIYERLRERVNFMEDSYNRLVETFRNSHPGIPVAEKSLEKEEDIISELEAIS